MTISVQTAYGASSEPSSAWPDGKEKIPVALVVAGIEEGLEKARGASKGPEVTLGPIHILWRKSGSRLGDQWVRAASWQQALERALRATEIVDEAPDLLELCLTYGYRDVDREGERRRLTNVHRGIRGIELIAGEHVLRYSPLQMLAQNIDFDTAIERLRAGLRARHGDVASEATLRTFEARQFIVTLEEGVCVTPAIRGNVIVPPDGISREAVLTLAEGLGGWLHRNTHDDGRMTYKYWPSNGRESTGNNLIRQFMATICLGRLAAFQDSDEAREAHTKNLGYNLAEFYKEEAGLGFVEYTGKVKLGAVALAALAIAEHPDRGKYARYEEGFKNMIAHLSKKDGGFQTWFRGHRPGVSSGQNFYPGEAQLYRAALISRDGDGSVLEDFLNTFEYYRDWHRKNRNPAFVPWHTQACFSVWQETQAPRLAEFVFEMNDWLVDYQQWDNLAYDDLKGRFYDPKRRDFGPPHASSTGVYLEGLVDAFLLARAREDVVRVERYRTAILRGLRSAMQLQFQDDIDMYYIAKRERVQGGMRTTEYNNEIRVDNVQHVLMAVLKVIVAFDDADLQQGITGTGITGTSMIDKSQPAE